MQEETLRMTPHLLAIEIGPVGEFISAARKTRDLWFGSGLFSDVARAVAQAVAKEIGYQNLIFPAPNSDDDLTRRDFAVADEIWAEVPASIPVEQLADVAKAAKKAAHKAWVSAAEEARKRIPSFLTEQFELQLAAPDFALYCGDVIECYAAWATQSEGYGACRKQVKRLLNGRTACRNFPPAPGGDAGLPKSSLDGARPTVLKPVKHDKAIRKLRLTQGEQLDAPGLVKRHGSEQQYPSVARIAADPWLRGAKGKEPKLFDEFFAECESFAQDQKLGRLGGGYPKFADFPFDGALLYESRHAEFAEELADYDANDINARRKAVREFLSGPMKPVRDALKALVKAVGEPQPYYAILAADGDGVGAALNAVEEAKVHREFSRKLAAFAGQVQTIVAEHYGAVVYAGGDDVLAFLPLDRAVECAAKLSEQFRTVWKDVTLSVGLSVGHFMEPLEDVLHAAHAALNEDAKGGEKNALAIRYQPRGGSPINIVGSWGSGIAGRLKRYAVAFNNGSLPSKAAYDLRVLAEQYTDESVWKSGPATGDVIRADAKRLLKRKGGDAATILGELTAKVESGKDLLNRAAEVLVARCIAKAMKQAGDAE